VVGAGVGGREADYKNFVNEASLNTPLMVSDGGVFGKYGARATPTVVLVDKNGKLIKSWSGNFPTSEILSLIG